MEQVPEAAAASGPATEGQAEYIGDGAGGTFEQYTQQQQPQGTEMWSGMGSSSVPFSALPPAAMHDSMMGGTDYGMLYPQSSMGGIVQVPFGLSEWHAPEPRQTGWGQLCSLMPCCPGEPAPSTREAMFPHTGEEQYMWRWTREGKLQLTCGQPIVPVPVIQEVHRRDKIIEVPQVDVLDAVKPKVFNQGVEHEVPVMQIQAQREDFDIKQFKYVETEVVVPIVTGFTHKFVPKWEIREVPRPVVKYVGKQEIIEVEVPQVKFVDRVVEREFVVDTIEKKVPKVIEVPKYVDTVKYVWTPVEKIVHVERFVPVFDVSLECPAPLIVPYPVQAVKEMPAVMVRKAIPGATQDGVVVEEQHVLEVASPTGTVRVPEEYIQEYRRVRPEEQPCCPCGPCAQPSTGAATSRSSREGICAGVCGVEEPEPHYLTARQMKKHKAKHLARVTGAAEGAGLTGPIYLAEGEAPEAVGSMPQDHEAAEAGRAALGHEGGGGRVATEEGGRLETNE